MCILSKYGLLLLTLVVQYPKNGLEKYSLNDGLTHRMFGNVLCMFTLVSMRPWPTESVAFERGGDRVTLEMSWKSALILLADISALTITDSMDMSLSKLQEMVRWTGRPGVEWSMGSQRVGRN